MTKPFLSRSQNNGDIMIQTDGSVTMPSDNKVSNHSTTSDTDNARQTCFGIEESVGNKIIFISSPSEVRVSLEPRLLEIMEQSRRVKMMSTNDDLDSNILETRQPSPYSSLPDVDGLPFMPFETIGEQVLREYLNDKESLRAYMPDHIHAASKECLDAFMKRYLLPRLANPTPLTREEVVENVGKYKGLFAQTYPRDFDPNWGLLQSVSLLLLDLDIECEIREYLNEPQLPHWERLQKLVDRAKRELLPMYKENPDLFYTM